MVPGGFRSSMATPRSNAGAIRERRHDCKTGFGWAVPLRTIPIFFGSRSARRESCLECRLQATFLLPEQCSALFARDHTELQVSAKSLSIYLPVLMAFVLGICAIIRLG